MQDRAQQQNEYKQDVHFSSTLDSAMTAWYAARQRFQHLRCKQYQDARHESHR